MASHQSDKGKTHFGFEAVDREDKVNRVRDVFSNVASKYDLMNDVMSLGMHRLWKRQVVSMMALRPGMKVLDLAGGSGDLTHLIVPKVGDDGSVVLSDINEDMLSVGKDRLTDAGLIDRVDCVCADAESLPFADQSFDRVIMAFGLRNVTEQQKALAEIHRVLKFSG